MANLHKFSKPDSGYHRMNGSWGALFSKLIK